MAWTTQDIDDNDSSPLHTQAYYLKTEDENGDPLTTNAERIYVNAKIPELDDDAVTFRAKKLTVNVNDALIAQGLDGAQRTAFLDGLKAIAAYVKAQ